MGAGATTQRASVRLVAIAAAIVCLWPAPARAQSTSSAALTIEAVGGANGYFRPGHPAAVRIAAQATRLVRGTMIITATNTVAEGLGNDGLARTSARALEPLPTRFELPFELQGGTTREFVVVMPTPPNPTGSIEIVARDGDQELASANVALQFREDDEYVGLLPDMAARLPQQSETVGIAGGVAVARFSNVTTALLRAGPDALAAYDILVSTSVELQTLTEGERRAVFMWVARGGRLLVDDERIPAGLLPPAWDLGSAPYRLVEAGEIRLTRGRAAAGAWAQILGPTPSNERRDRIINDIGAIGIRAAAVDATLSQDAGFRLPSVRWFIGLLVVYIALIGPLAYWFFHRRNATSQLWVAVPLAALVFTAGVIVFGGGLRKRSHTAHATLIETTAAGNWAYTHALVGSRTSDEVGLSLPEGWGPHTRLWTNVQPARRSDARAAAFTVRQEESGLVNSARVIAGEFVQFDAAGPVAPNRVPAAALKVTASSTDDGRISGTVTNGSGVPLERIGVFSYNDGALIERLEPGATVEFSLGAVVGFKGPSKADARVWPELESAAALPQASTTRAASSGRARASAALWTEYLGAAGPTGRDNGAVIAVAWTTALAAPVGALDGDTITFGRTAIVARTAVVAGRDGTTPDVSVARQLVRGPNRTVIAGGGERSVPLTFRFVVPPERLGATASLRLRTPEWVTAAEVYTGESWQRLDLGAPRRDGDVALPAAAFREGELLVRVAARGDSVNASTNTSDLLVFGRGG